MDELERLLKVFKLVKCLKELKDLKGKLDERKKSSIVGKRKSWWVVDKNKKSLIVKKRKRSCSVRRINWDRKKHGYYAATFQNIKLHDPAQFFINTRMTSATFDYLLSSLEPFMRKRSIREPISPECRLSLTLHYLSRGCSVQTLATDYKLGKETVRVIILETCGIIWKHLSEFYVAEPNSEELSQTAKQFYGKWNMPNCIGAIDGKHIATKCPPKQGKEYYYYKNLSSIVLLAVADARYTFSYVDVEAYDSQNVGGTFQNSAFRKRLLSNTLDLPKPKQLPNTSTTTPHYFVGDAAFPLTKNLMRPFPGKLLSKEDEVFNKRLSRARRVAENAFGVLVARWRVLLTTINMMPENAKMVVLACVAMHNFLLLNKEASETYCPESYIDWEDSSGCVQHGLWRKELENTCLQSIQPSVSQHNYGKYPGQIRNTLRDFVNTVDVLD